jgi:MFS family permease
LKTTTSSLTPLTWLAVAFAAFSLLPRVERKAKAPLLSPKLLRRRGVVIPLMLGIGAGLGEVGVMFLPDYAVQVLDASPARAGFLLTALVLGLTVGAPLAGRLTDRWGARPVVVGAFLQAAGLAVFALDTQPTPTTWYLGGPLLGLGLAALLGGPLRYALLHAAPKESKTAAQSLLSVSHAVGQVGTSALLGALAGQAAHGLPGAGLRDALLVAALLGLALVPLSALLPGGIHKPTDPTST